MTSDLCPTFKSLARATWRRLKASTVTGLPWSEETNTETLLAELAASHPRHVRVRATPRREETLNGSDWEWWIGAPGSWLGMRVQAKRLNIRKQRFVGIHRQKPRSASDTQMNTLIQQAAMNDLTPVYCFYVYSNRWPTTALWMAQDPGRADTEVCGCMIAHASAVRAIGSETLDKVSKACLPWHYLVCPTGNGDALAERVNSLLHRSAFSGDLAGLFSGSDSADFPLSNPKSTLPNYLRELSHTREASDSDELELSSRARRQGLAGYVLINVSPDGVWDQ